MHYLDLFARLGDAELAHLAGAPQSQVAALRTKVVQVQRAFNPWRDLLERLDDASLARLTGASVHAVAFWRRAEGVEEPPVQAPLKSASGSSSPRAAAPEAPGRPRPVTDVDTQPLDLGTPRSPNHASPASSGRPRPSVPYGMEDDDDDDLIVTVEDEPAPKKTAGAAASEGEEIDWSDL